MTNSAKGTRHETPDFVFEAQQQLSDRNCLPLILYVWPEPIITVKILGFSGS